MSHKTPSPERLQGSQLQLENLCAWIDQHIDESIGWPELIRQSGLSSTALQSLFWRWKATTPMTWIRQRRTIAKAPLQEVVPLCDAKEMLAYQNSGFSVDAGVCIEAHDRAGLERLLRYCARPPFAMERLRKAGSVLVYRCAKQRSEPTSDKRGAKADELTLTPLELIDRIAAL